MLSAPSVKSFVNSRISIMCLDSLDTVTRCDVDCGLGQACQWINDEEMCVCSPESCPSSTGLSPTVEHQPLCASNNMTFSSACAMEAWKCMNYQSGLYKKYDGVCQSMSSPATSSSDDRWPCSLCRGLSSSEMSQ